MAYDNIFKIFEWNSIYDNEVIYDWSICFFRSNTIGCLTANRGFSGLTLKSITSLLQLTSLRCSEELLYDNLIIWTENQLKNQNVANTKENKRKLLGDVLQLFKFEMGDNLEILTKNYVTSLFNWPFSHSTILYKSGASSWVYKITHPEKTVIYGFKMPLSNLSSELMDLTEKFTVQQKWDEIEEFEITFNASLIVKDIYFKKPIVCDEGGNQIKIFFTTKRTRLYQYNGNASNINSSQSNSIDVSLNLLSEEFVPKLHDIFTD